MTIDAMRLDMYRPAVIRLGENLYAAVFPLMKIFPADFCIRRAIEDGGLTPDSLVVETSSGTMALGLALVCNWRRLRLAIVTDYACDRGLQRRLMDLGASVEIVPGPAAEGGYQRARLDRVHAIRAEHADSWWVNQYDNPANSASYARIAGQLVEAVGPINCLIGSVGSGGSMCGTSSYLRLLCPEMTVVGVDTFGSVLFGQPDRPRQLRGLGNSLLPANLDHTAFDEVHWVTAAEAYRATRLLHQQTSLFRGGSSGATWMVARYWASRHPKQRVMCLLPDDGTRYQDTVYDDAYLQANGLALDRLPIQPCELSHPTEPCGQWACFPWNRRRYTEVRDECGGHARGTPARPAQTLAREAHDG